MEGPQSYQGAPQPAVRPELTYRDLVTIKQSIEKGVRENFYNRQEVNDMIIICKKVKAILEEYDKKYQA